jgi:PAS domain S-box-containing protein
MSHTQEAVHALGSKGAGDDVVVSWLAYLQDGAFVLGAGGLEFINQALADIVSYPILLLREAEFDWAALVHPDDRASVVATLLGQLRSSEPIERITFRVRRSDHVHRYVEVSTHPMPGPRLCGVVRDVTDSVSAEASLRRHNRLLRGVHEATRMLVGHTITDAQVGEVLERLGEAAGADRVCVEIYSRPLSEGPSHIMQRCAGVADSCPALPFFPQWLERLAQGHVIQANVTGLQEPERSELIARSIESLLAAPLLTEDKLRGFLRLDQIGASRVWTEVEIALLQLVADSLGTALAHRETEARLEATEGRLRRLVENSPDVLFRLALPSGVYEYVSSAATRVFGLTPEQFLAHPQALRQLIHPGWRSYYEDQWTRLLEGAMPPTSEYAIVHAQTGKIGWLHQRNTLVRDADGLPIAIEGIVTDVTERKVAETELRAREARLNSILRIVPVGIGLVAERVILDISDRICTMTGYSREELVGQGARMLYLSDADFEYVGREKYAQIEKWGSGSVETRWQRKDGTVIDVQLDSTPLVPGDNGAGVTFSALDITERKASEARMAASLHQKEVLIQEIHHRVKNNLALVSSLLGLQVLHLEDSQLHAPLNECCSRILALARLHDHLYITPDVEQVAMAPYIRQVVDELKNAFPCEVLIEVEAENLHLHMEQVMPCGLILSELITNALKHAFTAGSQGADGPLVRVAFGLAEGRVLLRVQDNGIGISDEVGEPNGSLGGSLVELLTRQLGGEVETTGLLGTCVTVRFPYMWRGGLPPALRQEEWTG